MYISSSICYYEYICGIDCQKKKNMEAIDKLPIAFCLEEREECLVDLLLSLSHTPEQQLDLLLHFLDRWTSTQCRLRGR
jgi:hypothetical protein